MIDPNVIYKNRLKPKKSFFEWCKDSFPIYRFANNSHEFISSERKGPVRTIKYRSNLKYKRYRDCKYFGIILGTSKRIEIQVYEVYFTIDSFTKKEEFAFELINMEQWIVNGNHNKISSRYGGSYGHGLLNLSNGFGGNYTNVLWVPQNYSKALENTELKYILDLDYILTSNSYYSLSFLIEKLVKYNHGLQVLQKLNSTKLFKDVILGKADMRRVNKKFILDRKAILKNNDLGYKELLMSDYLIEQGISVNYKALPLLSMDELDKVPNNLSLVKLQNYLVKQDESLSYYNDYLGMLRDLGTKLATDIVLFPKSLEEAHDKCVESLNAIKRETEEKQMISINRKLAKLEYVGETYQVISPKCLQDIVDEGSSLSHCVGSSRYLDGHAAGDFAIMFVRKANDRETPLYTFTYHYDKRISAIHGYGNQDSKNEHYEPVKAFLEEWLKWVKTSKKKPKTIKNKNRSQTQLNSIENTV